MNEVVQETRVRLRVRDLTVAVTGNGAQVVQSVSFDLAPGEVLGIVGESGSGKTTLGLSLLGYTRRGLTIQRGSVELDGENLLGLPAKKLRSIWGRQVAYVPQDPASALNPARRIGPQLKEAMTVHGVDAGEADVRIDELLREVGLDTVDHVLMAYPHQLSGGQQQRVGIAMAFSCRPRLIVLDEPTTGLDVKTQRTVLETILALCAQYGVAAAYVSHDVAVVREISTRVAVVYSGRIVEIGHTEELFTCPQHPYTRGLLQAVPTTDQSLVLQGIEGFPPRPGYRPLGCAFAPRCAVRVETCMTTRPELVPIGAPGHAARCHLVSSSQVPLPLPTRRREEAAVIERPDEPLLRASGLRATYGNTSVLDNVDLEVRQGECVALVGESGSGKSTFARCLIGLHTDWSGSISLDGHDLPAGIPSRSKSTLRAMQYIFQNPHASLNPRRTIGSLVAQPLDQLGATSRDQRWERAATALEAVSLPDDFMNRYPAELSGGERQRVAIARALVVDPKLLICDEITSALDVSVQASVIETLLSLQADRGLALIFITHNLPLVRSIAQRVAVLDKGVIVESGLASSVLDAPQASYTQELLAAAPA